MMLALLTPCLLDRYLRQMVLWFCVTAKIRNQPKTTQTSQKLPKPAKNHPNQPKTTQTSQKPPKNHRKPAKNQANHPESQSTNSKNIKIYEGQFTQGVYKTKT